MRRRIKRLSTRDTLIMRAFVKETDTEFMWNVFVKHLLRDWLILLVSFHVVYSVQQSVEQGGGVLARFSLRWFHSRNESK